MINLTAPFPSVVVQTAQSDTGSSTYMSAEQLS